MKYKFPHLSIHSYNTHTFPTYINSQLQHVVNRLSHFDCRMSCVCVFFLFPFVKCVKCCNLFKPIVICLAFLIFLPFLCNVFCLLYIVLSTYICVLITVVFLATCCFLDCGPWFFMSFPHFVLECMLQLFACGHTKSSEQQQSTPTPIHPSIYTHTLTHT